jgi:hypothetical protein
MSDKDTDISIDEAEHKTLRVVHDLLDAKRPGLAKAIRLIELAAQFCPPHVKNDINEGLQGIVTEVSVLSDQLDYMQATLEAKYDTTRH